MNILQLSIWLLKSLLDRLSWFFPVRRNCWILAVGHRCHLNFRWPFAWYCPPFRIFHRPSSCEFPFGNLCLALRDDFCRSQCWSKLLPSRFSRLKLVARRRGSRQLCQIISDSRSAWPSCSKGCQGRGYLYNHSFWPDSALSIHLPYNEWSKIIFYVGGQCSGRGRCYPHFFYTLQTLCNSWNLPRS